MQARFLLGPAGSGKTFRCVAEVRAELLRSPDGPPLIFLAPKQATFQIERQLLDPEAQHPLVVPASAGSKVAGEKQGDRLKPGLQTLSGYTRLHILSFERLAAFVFDRLGLALPELLSEEGRVMVLRALLARHQNELKIFRATARLTGFATQLSLLLREFQRSRVTPELLAQLAARVPSTGRLNDKLHDLALLLDKYQAWLAARRAQGHNIEDANRLLDLATDALASAAFGVPRLRGPGDRLKAELQTGAITPGNPPQVRIGALWLDGFAEMTPQETALLAALVPHCERATLAFCLDGEPRGEISWLSPWTVVGRTFERCREGLAHVLQAKPEIEVLPRDPARSRFGVALDLATLERAWASGVGSSRREEAPSEVRNSAQETHGVSQSLLTSAATIRLVACANAEGEAVLAAREILRHVQAGGRFRDCAILVRSLEGYHDVLRRVLGRYEIPFFLDRREAVAHHPLAELTRYALRTVAFDWQQEDWFGALKTGLAQASDEEVDWLENEALRRGWSGRVWREALAVPDDARLGERLERIRQRVMPAFERLAKRLQSLAMTPTGRHLGDAIQELWSAIGIEARLEAWSGSAAEAGAGGAAHGTVLTQMDEWLGNLRLAFADEKLPLRDWLPVLEAGLAGMTVGVIPPSLDQVLVGSVDRSRNPDLQLAFVLGVNEGRFPAPPARGVLLSDLDRAEIEAHGIWLGANHRQRLGHENYFGYIAFTRARRQLTVTWSKSDAGGNELNPSSFVAAIKRAVPGVAEEKSIPANWPDAVHRDELVPYILTAQKYQGVLPPPEPERRSPDRPVPDRIHQRADREIGAPLLGSGVQSAKQVSANSHPGPLPLGEGESFATPGGCSSVQSIGPGGDGSEDLESASNVPRCLPLPAGEGSRVREKASEFSSALDVSLRSLCALDEFSTVILRWEQARAAAGPARLGAAVAARLYGNELSTSVSALEDFTACPFHFLVARALRAQEREEFVVDARERGSFQHEVLQKFHERVRGAGKQWRDLSRTEARQIIREIGGAAAKEFRGGLFAAGDAAKFAASVLIENLERLMDALIGWAGQYRFDPAEAEVSFGLAGAKLPPWRIELEGGRALMLRGRIDRVDLCRTGAGEALVVICDYKSGGKHMDDARLRHGLELQLLSYLAALTQMPEAGVLFGVERLRPAGVFYVPLRGRPGSGGTRREAGEAGRDAKLGFQHRGRFDGGHVREFDNRNEGKGDQFRFKLNADGAFAAHGNEAMAAGGFPALVRETEATLREIGTRIFRGEADVAPYRLGQETACDLCAYRAVCRFDPWTMPYRRLA